jgi:hypothetical protein
MTPMSAWTITGLLFALALPAQAGRPFTTEDAGVLERGSCEWEGVAARWHVPDSSTTRALSTQLGCGVGARTQVALGYASARTDGQSVQSLALGGKTSLSRDAQSPLQLTLAWGGATLKAPGRSHHHDTAYLNLVASHTYANGWTAHANLGALRSRLAEQDSTNWALALEKAVGGGLDLGAELYGDDRSEPWLGLGARWTASDAFSLNASWARQGGREGGRLLSAGFKLAF